MSYLAGSTAGSSSSRPGSPGTTGMKHLQKSVLNPATLRSALMEVIKETKQDRINKVEIQKQEINSEKSELMRRKPNVKLLEPIADQPRDFVFLTSSQQTSKFVKKKPYPKITKLSSPFGSRQPVEKPTKKGRIIPIASNNGAEQWLLGTNANSIVQFNSLLLSAVAREQAHLGTLPPADQSIFRKINVRETLYVELKRLIDNQSDEHDIGPSCLMEIVELVRAMRYETVELIEEIVAWSIADGNVNVTISNDATEESSQQYKGPFLYRGVDYLVKICSDLEFMDQYDEIVDKFGFEFKMNPLTYPEGGKIIIGHGSSAEGQGLGGKESEPLSSARRRRVASLAQHAKRAVELKKQNPTKTKGNNNNAVVEDVQYDGFSVNRLMQAERSIQQHFDRRRTPTRAKATDAKTLANSDRSKVCSMGAFVHTPFIPHKDDRHGLKSSGHKGTDEGSVGGSVGGSIGGSITGSVGSGEVKGMKGGSVGSGEVDKVVEKVASAIAIVDSPSQGDHEVLKVVKPTPILKPTPGAITYIDPSTASASSSNRQQPLSVTFLDDHNHDNEVEMINQVGRGSSTNVGQGVRSMGTWIESPSLVASGGSGVQGGVSNYIQELLAVGIQDRVKGFSRSTQINKRIPTITGTEDNVAASFDESMNLMRQRRKGSASDANSIGSIDTIDEYQRILLAEIDAIDSAVMLSNGMTTPTSPQQSPQPPQGNKNKNTDSKGGGRISPSTVVQLSPPSLALAEAIAVVDSDTAAVNLYYNSLSSTSGISDPNQASDATLSTELFKKSGAKKTSITPHHYRKMKRERMAKLEAEVASMNLKEKEWLNHTEELQATCQQLEELGALMEAKRIKALKQCREKDAIDLAAEISGINAQRNETNATLRTVHRDIFFLVLERERIVKLLQKLSEELAAELKRSQRSNSLSKTLHKAKAALQDQQQQEAGKGDGGFTATSTADGKQMVTFTAASSSASASANKIIVPVDEKDVIHVEYDIYDVNSDTNEDQHTRKQRLNAEREKAEEARLNQIRMDAERRVHESFLLAQQEAAAKAAEEKKEREWVESKLLAKMMRIETQKMSMNLVEQTIQTALLAASQIKIKKDRDNEMFYRIKDLAENDPIQFKTMVAMADSFAQRKQMSKKPVSPSSSSVLRESQRSGKYGGYMKGSGLDGQSYDSTSDQISTDGQESHADSVTESVARVAMMTHMAFNFLAKGDNEVTFGAVKEMDLIADLISSGMLTEQTLINHFRNAGGHMASAVHKSTLDLEGFEMLLDLLAPLSDDLVSSAIQEEDLEDDDVDEYQRGLGGTGVDVDGNGVESSTSVSEMLELARYYATHASAAAASSSSPLSELRALNGLGTGSMASTRPRPRGIGCSTSYDYSNNDAARFVTGLDVEVEDQWTNPSSPALGSTFATPSRKSSYHSFATGNDIEVEGSPSMGSIGGSVKSMGGEPSGLASPYESLTTGYEVEVEGIQSIGGGPSGLASPYESLVTGYEVEVESIQSIGGPSGLASPFESLATGYEVEVMSTRSMGEPSGLVSRTESLATGYEVEGSVSGDEHEQDDRK